MKVDQRSYCDTYIKFGYVFIASLCWGRFGVIYLRIAFSAIHGVDYHVIILGVIDEVSLILVATKVELACIDDVVTGIHTQLKVTIYE